MRPAPIPKQVFTSKTYLSPVTGDPMYTVRMFDHMETQRGLVKLSDDGSFALWFVAGCLPWKFCGINEPTDWRIGE